MLNAPFDGHPLPPLHLCCEVQLTLQLGFRSNSTKKAVLTKLLVAYLVEGECDDKTVDSMIFVKNVEKETCFGIIHFKPKTDCPFHN